MIPPSSQKLCATPYPFTMFPCYVKGVPLGVLSNFQRSDILSAMFKPRVSLSHCYPISHSWESLHNFSILYIYITCCLKLTVRFRELIYSQLSLMLYISITCCLKLTCYVFRELIYCQFGLVTQPHNLFNLSSKIKFNPQLSKQMLNLFLNTKAHSLV